MAGGRRAGRVRETGETDRGGGGAERQERHRRKIKKSRRRKVEGGAGGRAKVVAEGESGREGRA